MYNCQNSSRSVSTILQEYLRIMSLKVYKYKRLPSINKHKLRGLSLKLMVAIRKFISTQLHNSAIAPAACQNCRQREQQNAVRIYTYLLQRLRKWTTYSRNRILTKETSLKETKAPRIKRFSLYTRAKQQNSKCKFSADSPFSAVNSVS